MRYLYHGIHVLDSIVKMVKPKNDSQKRLSTNHWEQRHNGALPNLFIQAKKGQKHKNTPILHKRIGKKLGIK